MAATVPNPDEPVLAQARRDFTALRDDLTIGQALQQIRREGIGEKVIYFYVVDAGGKLLGVLPTRRLLMAPAEARVGDLMVKRVVALPATATVLDACELFVMHKFLAFPVVDAERRLVGVVDVSLFTEEVLDLLDLAERERADTLFEALGFRVAQLRDAGPVQAVRYRLPWLLATVASGTVCALLAGMFEATLAQALVLAFFLTLVLGLGESVSVQSMTVTLQALRATRPTRAWYLGALRREVSTALLLGLACGTLVGVIAWLWRGEPLPAGVIGGSILLAITAASAIGLSVPALLHALKLDPKIAAGPVSLALTDICTLLIYFNAARLVLTPSP
jgi:magnesium transporter